MCVVLLVGGLFIPLLLGKFIALTFSEVLAKAALLDEFPPLKDALSLPGIVDELLRMCPAPTALCCDVDDFIENIFYSFVCVCLNSFAFLFVVGAAVSVRLVLCASK